MSLEGSLETIALPEVLHLLSDTSKSGELLVSGDRGEGRLWFDAGRLNGFDVPRCTDAADALFELLRAAGGRFSFDADTPRPDSATVVGEEGGGGDVRPVLEVAQARLEEWSGIVAVVPSLQHKVALSAEAPSESVEISAEQWSLVVTIGEGRSVGDVLELADLPEFGGCRSLKTLVEAGLAAVAEPDDLSAPEEPEAVTEVTEVGEPFEISGTDELVDGEAPSLSDLELEDHTEAPVEAQDDSSGVVVNGGTFDGQDFVFKASTGFMDDGYEPQPVPYPEVHTNGHGTNGHSDQGAFDAESADGSDEGSVSSRAALEALLAEIPAEEENSAAEGVPADGEEHDGLADRGPWTSQELASFDQVGGWHEDQPGPDEAVAAHEYDFSSDADAELADAQPASDFHFDPQADDHSEQTAELGVAEESEESEEELEEPQPEPVNRGLLLKFLSSVRS